MCAEILDATKICVSFPEIPANPLDRASILAEVADRLSKYEIVYLDGHPSSGRTTLAAIMARRNAETTVSLFVSPASRFTLSETAKRACIYNQMYWIVHREQPDPKQVNRPKYDQMVYQLQRFAKRQPVLFVVDGLNQLPKELRHHGEGLWELLPFGCGFRFLITDSVPANRLYKAPQAKSTSLSVLRLDKQEAAELLLPLDLEQAEVEAMHELAQGRPGHLVSMKRILQSGETTAEELINEAPRRLPDLFALEWRSALIDENGEDLLALLAFTHASNIDELSRLSGLAESQVTDTLQSIHFIRLTGAPERAAFTSPAYQSFAQQKLEPRRQGIIDKTIDALLEDSEGVPALTNLPHYLTEVGRHEDLVRYLAPEYFYRGVERLQTFSLLREAAKHGASAALGQDMLEDSLRLVVSRATLCELDGAASWDNEVNARIALGDFEDAIATAQAVPIKEDRLRLLSFVARAMVDRIPTGPPLALVDQIRSLLGAIQPQSFDADRAMDIASNVVRFLPDEAVSLIEGAHAAKNATPDFALAALAIRLAETETEADASTPSTGAASIRSRIADAEAIEITSAVSATLIRASSGDEALSAVDPLPAAIQVSLLARWITKHPRHRDAARVVDHALSALVRTTELTPTARLIRRLACPLPHVASEPELHALTTRFEALLDSAEKYGPTVDFYRLRLLLAEGEINVADLETGVILVLEALGDMQGVDDVAVRCECLAYLLRLAARAASNHDSKDLEELAGRARDLFLADAQQLLQETASHRTTLSGALTALATTDLEMATELANRINTEARRADALGRILSRAIREAAGFQELRSAAAQLHLIATRDLQDIVLARLVRRLASDNRLVDPDAESISFLRGLHERISEIGKADLRSWTLAQHILSLKRLAIGPASLVDQISNGLREAIRGIDVECVRVNAMYGAALNRSTASEAEARELLAQADELKDRLLLSSPDTAWLYTACVRLASSALSGLIAGGEIGERDYSRFSELVSRIESPGEKALIWSDLALRHMSEDKASEGSKIVRNQVCPLIGKISEADSDYREQIIAQSAPALWEGHKRIARELIAPLQPRHRDRALRGIVDFLIDKELIFEPCYVDIDQPRLLPYARWIDVLEALEMAESDSMISITLYRLMLAVTARRKKVYTSEQKADLASRAEAIVSSKLPSSARFIAHDGYVILTTAYILRMKPSATESDWLELRESCHNLDNVADRTLVLAALQSVVPTKYDSLRKQLITDFDEALGRIPCAHDRAERLAAMAEYCSGEKGRARSYIRKAIAEMRGGEVSDRLSKGLIDFAYRIDADLATELAEAHDDDPARSEKKAELRRGLTLRKAKQEFADSATIPNSLAPADLPQVAWDCLGQLNGGRMRARALKQLSGFISVVGDYPLSDAYPILAFLLANIRLKHAGTNVAARRIRPIVDDIFSSCDVAARLIAKSNSSAVSIGGRVRSPTSLVGPGERGRALARIQSWIETKVEDYLVVCDPFFGPEDLPLLEAVLGKSPSVDVTILCSLKQHSQLGMSPPYEDAYTSAWSRFSYHKPPHTYIVIIGTEDGSSPIHDRWFLTKGGGLESGTSVGSIGEGKYSGLREMSPEEASEREVIARRYLNRQVKEHDGKRLLHRSFSL